MSYFPNFADDSKIWIYQSKTKIEAAQIPTIQSQIDAFCHQWAAHGQALQAAGKVLHDHFIVLAVNAANHQASGCSIDSSVHFIKELEQKFSLNLFERQWLAIQKDGEVEINGMTSVLEAIENETLSSQTLFFDNTIQNLTGLNNKWLKPIEQSWLASRIKKSA